MENQKQPEQLTPEQQLENAVAGALDWKHRYGAELTYSSEIQISLMQSQVEVRELKKQILNERIELSEQLKEANAKIAQLTMKPEEAEDKKESDNKASGKKQ